MIPGVELTSDTNGDQLLAVDVKECIDHSLPVGEIVARIHEQGGIAIAPPPHHGSEGRVHSMIQWEHHGEFAKRFDAWVIATRDDVFKVVSLKTFSDVANSDSHKHRSLLVEDPPSMREERGTRQRGASAESPGLDSPVPGRRDGPIHVNRGTMGCPGSHDPSVRFLRSQVLAQLRTRAMYSRSPVKAR